MWDTVIVTIPIIAAFFLGRIYQFLFATSHEEEFTRREVEELERLYKK
jgi:hypothetical protein